ncbi:MAG: hypothetical protein IIB57_01345 [Planctomycetes bacterium]|nr:hypothetical protein [Planctomycetota bacterium]
MRIGSVGESGACIACSRRADRTLTSVDLQFSKDFGGGNTVTAVAQQSKAMNVPDTADLQRTARETLDVIRQAHEQLRHEVAAVAQRQRELEQEREGINSSRRSLEVLSEELEVKRGDQEVQLAELNKQVAELATSADRIESDRITLQREHEALAAKQASLEDAQRQQTEAAKALDERGRVFSENEARLGKQIKELEPLRCTLDQRQTELEERSEQLASFETELTEKHRMLATLQDQLTEEQQQVARQRRLMLERFGTPEQVDSDRRTVSRPTPEMEEPTGVTQVAVKETTVPVATPQPAAGGKADQFRKLRRDAKRRAIGV